MSENGLAPLITVRRYDVLKPKDTMRSEVLVQLPDKAKYKAAVAVEDLAFAPGVKKVYGKSAIPAGTYPLDLRISPKFSGSFYTKDDVNLISKKEWEVLPKWQRNEFHVHKLIWVRNIPGYEYVLIHWGNTCLDTDGCLVVGTRTGMLGAMPGVLESKDAYVRLYAAVAKAIQQGIDDKAKQSITYIDDFPPSQYVHDAKEVA